MIEKVNNIYFILLSAFSGGFAVGLNSKANEEGITMLKFFAKVVIHGISGTIIGLLINSTNANIYLICGMAAFGGLFGEEILKYLFNIKPPKDPPKDGGNDDDDLTGYYEDV